jgi:hypothetical protein
MPRSQCTSLGISLRIPWEGILPKALPNGSISEEITERLSATMAQKVEWVRQAAGERFHELELNMVILVL